MALLEIDELTRRFGGIVAVDRVTMRDNVAIAPFAMDLSGVGNRPGTLSLSGTLTQTGVVSTAPVADAPGTPIVVWIECPSRPVPRYPIVTPPTLSG